MKNLYPSFIVGIGASAGGVSAFKALLGAMPPDTGMAFVIVARILPTANNQLAKILSKHTTMKVMVASNGMPIRPNNVYVNSPNADLMLENYTFKVITPRSGKKQIDLLFSSLADFMGPRAIGIVLSGYDGDGTAGCRHIKAKGGTTFAQDNSAEVHEMSYSAQAAGCIDFVLPPASIPSELHRLASDAVDQTSAQAAEQLTEAAHILIAATPDDVVNLERILGPLHQFVVTSTLSEALAQLEESAFDLIMIGVHFDQSRMFDLLPCIQKSSTNADTPVICFSTRNTLLTRTMHKTIQVASDALGAWMYLDQQEYSADRDADVDMRRIIERCLAGEARKKTQSERIDIHKQRGEIQLLRESLANENNEWSENLDDQVLELRRNLATLLLELCESNVNSLTQQERVADSRERNDHVSAAVKLVEDGADHKERRMLFDETTQTAKELRIANSEDTKRKNSKRKPDSND